MFKNFSDKISRLDELLLFDQNKDFKDAFLKKLLFFFTELGSSLVILFLIVILAVIDDYQILYIFLPIYFFQLLIIELIKRAFKRRRPKTYTSKTLWGYKMESGSFPSGHTSNIFCFAFLLANFYQVNLITHLLLFFIAGAVGFSRIILGKHYFIDVLAGGLFGILFGILGTYLWITFYLNTDWFRLYL